MTTCRPLNLPLQICVAIVFIAACHREKDVLVTGPASSGPVPVPVSSTPAAPQQTCASLPADHNVLYERGVRLIDPYMKLLGRAAARGAAREQELHEGIACLDRVLKLAPSNWAALWMRGKAYQALELHERARDSFRSAYDIHPQNPDVGRELVFECLELGLTKEAVRVAGDILGTSPDDPGLRANLAVALVLDGDVDRAKKEASQALAQDPSDSITRALEARIDEVARGVRPRPRSLREFERAHGP